MPRILRTGAAPVGRPQMPSHLPHQTVAPKADAGRYDQIQLSRQPEGEARQVLELTGRISQQIRASHTAGQIASLSDQVRQGTYQLNADRIAANLLLMPREGELE